MVKNFLPVLLGTVLAWSGWFVAPGMAQFATEAFCSNLEDVYRDGYCIDPYGFVSTLTADGFLVVTAKFADDRYGVAIYKVNNSATVLSLVLDRDRTVTQYGVGN
ncbi:MAG TPA: hypothetical protein V6C65_20060, partial [Allocoleopsis sp.]